MPGRDPEALARAYYESIDAGEFDRLAGLLADDFRQVRGDRTIEGRDRFVRFMREERPESETTHTVDSFLRADRTSAIAVRGRLLRADCSVWFGFVDVFEVEGGRLTGLTTYTNRRIE